jgi:hypothetical protein
MQRDDDTLLFQMPFGPWIPGGRAMLLQTGISGKDFPPNFNKFSREKT